MTRSKTSTRILSETPKEVREMVINETNKLVMETNKMITPSELMLGNILKPKEAHYAAYGEFNLGIVTLIQEDRFTVSNHYPGKWFEGIPLTPEILTEWCGFEYLDYRDKYQHTNYQFQLKQNDFNDWYVLDYPEYVSFAYLHEFQNWYYCQYKKHLTINLPVSR